MEESVLGGKKAYELLESLAGRHSPGSAVFYLRRSDYADPRFLELDLEKLRLLEKDGVLKMSDYVRQGTVDSNAIQLDLSPKGQQFLKSRVTTTTQTVTETFREPEEPAWKATKRLRDFGRTERGCTIMMMSPEALASDVRSHVQAIKSGTIPRKDAKSHQMWLRHELGRRWDEIPSELRHEAEDCRDLELTGRKKA
jgi:hypothetical protein